MTGGPVLAMTAVWLVWELRREASPDQPRFAIFWTIILLAATIVLQELLRPKPRIEDSRPASLGEFQFPTATEGRVVPLVWGRVRIRGPNVVWYGDLRSDAISENVKTGLWSSKRVIRGFRYFIGCQFAICRGPDVTLKRVWIGEDEVFDGTVTGGSRFDIDEPELFGGDEYGNGGIQSTVDFYSGTTSQAVNAYLNTTGRQRVTSAATPTAPRYSGTCYLVARELTSAAPTSADRGAYFGNSSSIKAWSFEVERFSALFSGQSGSDHKVGSDDCNPMNVIYELLTNTEWGFGFSSTAVDVGPGSTFLAAATTLAAEGNGFAMVLDRPMRAKEFMIELQRQIDGVVFLDQQTGKWRVKLVRDDYNINTVPQFTDSNVKEVRDFTRGTWEDTTNTIQVKYAKRADDYKESHALAQDMANAIMAAEGSTTSPDGVVATSNYPGVKLSALASNIAWRDLRGQSYPLARANFVVTREFWDLRMGDVIAWTTTKLGFVKLPMRVMRIDYGELESNEMVVDCVQDVFKFAAASMGTPPGTGWSPPVVSLIAFPSTQQLAFEAPRGLIVRDPAYGGDPNVSKLVCAARRQGSELAFNIGQRNSAGALSGAYTDAGDVISFMRIGKLSAALNTGTAIPTSTITIVPDPDGQAALEAVFDDTATLTDLGVDLAHLILVGNELMLVSSAANSGANVNLQNVYRGVLDTVQGAHLINAPVYLLFVGAGLTTTSFPNTNNTEVELRMRSASTTYAGAVTTITNTMAKRPLRPYPPNASLYNGSSTPFGAPNADGDGSGMNGTGFNVSWRRRRLTTTDELSELLADNVPDASTEYRVRVFVAPAGINVEVHTSAWATGVGPILVNRLSLWNRAAAGTQIRVQIETRHDILAEVDLTSRYNLFHDVTPTSAYDPRFYLGGQLTAGTPSSSYTAAATGTFTLRIGAAYATSNVQVSINGAAFATVIAAGATSGTFSASTSDTIRVQHTTNETPSPQLVQIENPSAAVVAYGVLTN